MSLDGCPSRATWQSNSYCDDDYKGNQQGQGIDHESTHEHKNEEERNVQLHAEEKGRPHECNCDADDQVHLGHVRANDLVERPTTDRIAARDAAHADPRTARTRC